ncbi:ABC transporter substrate-binding protein [Cupriavidus sp. UME77]|uniref:ABC transporter substrate-binding protein n=1 Tax=Cupriavidus sp. UME77 TaxID=1862321 RepID=UPI0016015938|nr:ABC transporter substrate-binding protein [Cupriavidus sp. UME77]MBB1633545.1 ABC transporter substrate-binding protein [Cupriavidus sp. UME77]
MTDSRFNPRRRLALRQGLAAGAMLAAPAIVRAQTPKIRLGFWPIAGGIPLYAGIETGLFKRAGLEVEAVKFASAQQVVEAMIAGRIEGSANGTASAALGLGEITSPGLCKIFAANPSNATLLLDEILVAKDSPFKTLADLKGKRIGCGPGIQNVTLAKVIFEKNGYTDVKPVELPVGQHVAALAAGQLDAVYTLEPTGTVGRLNGTCRALEYGVISRYVLGNASLPWFGGSASLTSAFLSSSPELSKRFIAAYGQAIDMVRKDPVKVRPFLKGYTSIDDQLAKEVPLPGFTLYNEFKPADIEAFQKFFDVFHDRKLFARRVPVADMLYRG